MNWQLAVEKNHEALRRVLAMLAAMVGIAGSDRPATLPRHLHRFVLSLLRPAESATRRLIIVAARGLVVKLPKPRPEKSERRPPRLDPRAMPEWARLRLEHGLPIEFPRGEPIPFWARETPEREERKPTPRVPFFPMFDPMKRFDRKPVRKRIPEDRMPRISLLNDDGWSVSLHLRRAASPPPPPTPDDPLDATSIHRRFDAIGRVLDDLPREARRFARWTARWDARRAAERERSEHAGHSQGVGWEELGLTPEAIALLNRSKRLDYPARHPITAQTAQPKRRFTRTELLRPGRPPGWRKRPTHEVHEVLNDLHGLAVWARERRDSS